WKQMQAQGTLATTANLTGTVDEPELRGFLRIEDGRIAMAEKSVPIEKIGIDIDFKSAVGSNIMQLKKVTAVCDNTVVEADGKIELNHVTVPKLHKNKYALNMSVKSPEQNLAGGWNVRDLDGTIELATVEEDLQRLTFNRVGGTFGEGSIRVDGFADINDFRLAELAKNRFDMNVRADAAQVKFAGLVDALLDGSIEIEGPGGKQASVKGALTLDKGRFGIPMPTGGGGGEMYALRSVYPSPDLDVRLKLGKNMVVRDRGLVTPLKATDRLVHVHGTPQRPVVEGIVEAQAGRTQIPGGVANIRELGLQYRLGPSMGAFARDPLELKLSGSIWGVAETVLEDAALYGQPLGRVDITLALTGRLPDAIDIRLSSDPPLEQQHIYALLQSASLGYLVGDGDGQQLSSVMSETFTRALAAGFRTTVFKPIETQIRETLGLDQLQVNVAFDQAVEVKLGKYVMENLLVSYTSSVGDSADSYEVDISYEIARKIRVTYHTDEDQEERLQLERVWEF
ncbi:MAG: translocation/assembly module TamB domain-containing protein, partial [Armatimonadota bacterium]